MGRIKRVVAIKAIYILIDLFCIWASIFLACWMRQNTLPFPFTLHNIFLDYRHPYNLAFISWFFIVPFFNNINDLYETRREQFESEEIWE